jgi:putative flippase GtrA
MTGWLTQILRFAAVGLSSNGLLYLAYLGLTAIGVSPRSAMTLAYGAGVLQTFAFNRRWTFRHRGAGRPALIRYAATYILGYFINLVGLIVLVGRLGFPHQIVQAGMIISLAVLTFLLQRYWVFRPAVEASTP